MVGLVKNLNSKRIEIAIIKNEQHQVNYEIMF